jgi:hypothetical protein
MLRDLMHVPKHACCWPTLFNKEFLRRVKECRLTRLHKIKNVFVRKGSSIYSVNGRIEEWLTNYNRMDYETQKTCIWLGYKLRYAILFIITYLTTL